MDCYINVPRREAIAARAMRRTTGGPSHPARPDDYEDVLAPAYAFQHALAQSRSTGAGHVQRQNRLASRVVPIGSSLLCRAGLRAMDKVVSKLAIEVEHVVFGHTHRAGPLEGDGEWRTAGGVGLTNTGSWVRLSGSLTGLGDAPGYSPGYCAIVADSGAPRLVNVLEDTALGHDHSH
jgi:hypothetical protein